jgi:hypothetical protein
MILSSIAGRFTILHHEEVGSRGAIVIEGIQGRKKKRRKLKRYQ